MKKSVILAVLSLLIILPSISTFALAQSQSSPVTDFIDGTTNIADKVVKFIQGEGLLDPITFKKLLLVILLGIFFYKALKAVFEDSEWESKTWIMAVILSMIIYITIPAGQLDSYLLNLKTVSLAALFLFFCIGAALLSAKVSSIKQAKGLWWFFIVVFAIFAIYRLPTALGSQNKLETAILLLGIVAGIVGKYLVPKIRQMDRISRRIQNREEYKLQAKFPSPVIFCILLMFIVIISFASAQFSSSQLENYGNQLENAQNSINSINDKGKNISSAEFLTKSWIEFIKKNKFIGPPIAAIDRLLIALNPLLSVILQSDYNDSPGQFLISLTLWLILIGVIYLIAGTFLEKNWLGFLTSILIVSLVGTLGVINALSTAIYVTLPAAIQASLLVIILGLIIILALIFIYGHKMMKGLYKKAKDKLRSEEEEEEFEYKKGMRRGGEWSGKSKFIGKEAAERYARRYGDEAAKGRFG